MLDRQIGIAIAQSLRKILPLNIFISLLFFISDPEVFKAHSSCCFAANYLERFGSYHLRDADSIMPQGFHQIDKPKSGSLQSNQDMVAHDDLRLKGRRDSSGYGDRL